mmetsp:Transcript_38324/g.74290  ORF Transcript_38324/g.74290 Transcript_38324/m.74290 type:complete len:83 (+) Transcript_38324:144-392(+)
MSVCGFAANAISTQRGSDQVKSHFFLRCTHYSSHRSSKEFIERRFPHLFVVLWWFGLFEHLVRQSLNVSKLELPVTTPWIIQ